MTTKEPIVEDSEIDGLVAGSIQDLAIMEQVIQNKLAQSQAEIAELKEELKAEREVILSLRKQAETGLRSVDEERAHVLQQQADLADLIEKNHIKSTAIKEAVRQFCKTLESI